MAAVSPIPSGYHAITPYLIVQGAEQAIAFYQKAFSAVETMRMPGPGGKVMHAEIRVGDSMVMLADEFPDMGITGPMALGGTPVSLLLYVENVDAVFAQALALGASQKRPLENQFYGDRSGTVTDPFGHVWTIATHIGDLTPEQMAERMAQAMGK